MPRTLLLIGLLPVLGPLLGGCGYTPSPHTDTQSPRFQADLEACRTSVPEAVNKNNAKRALRWFASGVTRWGDIDDGIRACMQGKGWGQLRACTAEELRTGAGERTVTARGLQCVDPGQPG